MPVDTPLSSSVGLEMSGNARGIAAPTNKIHASPALSSSPIERMLALGQMSRGFVHDFRNVLGVISAAVRLAERHADDPLLVTDFLVGAQEGVERGLRMTTRLLNFASGHDCDIHAHNVNDALVRLEILLRYAAGSGIRIVVQLGPDVPDVEFEFPQFNAAIMNLVVNARDAMPDGGTIQISTALISRPVSRDQGPDHYVRVRVRDNGTGMDAGVRRKIFDPFFTTKAGAGTGLGIPQVDAFVRQSGGFLRIDTAIGVGTTFDLFFPCADGSADLH
ncbi:two-component system sensor histidine kinase NtrB [Tardibacter chloracetimidivorans]|nr:ATP-binding protein [Tardibacter chloracetimidivorans]